jgi:hypothetical protein
VSGAIDRDPVPVEHAPARLSSGLAALFALAAAVTTLGVVVAIPLGVGGCLVLLLGAARGTRKYVNAGAAALVGGVLLAATYGLTVELVLAGVTAGVLAWDAADNALSVGRQLGRGADTARGEVVHVAASTLVGTIVATGSYVVFQVAAGGRPLAALALVLFGAVVMLLALGR